MHIFRKIGRELKMGCQIKPDKVYFEVTNCCNFKCDFCPINSSKREKRHMDFSLFKKGINDIVKDEITGTIAYHILGEPLLYPNIFEALEYVKIKGLRNDLTTNGSLLTEDRVKRIVEGSLIDKLNISVETISEKEHEARDSNISFEKYYGGILEAVRYIKKSGSKTNIELCLMNTFSKKYFDIDKDMGVIVEKNAFKRKLIPFIIDIYKAIDKKVTYNTVETLMNGINLQRPGLIRIDDNITVYVQLLADWGNAFTSKTVHPCKHGCCGYALTNVGILNSGEVTICCVDYDGRTSMGNIHNNSLKEILEAGKAGEILDGFSRMKVVEPYCQRCFGSTSKTRAAFKGLLSIYLFKILNFQPANVKEINLE